MLIQALLLFFLGQKGLLVMALYHHVVIVTRSKCVKLSHKEFPFGSKNVSRFHLKHQHNVKISAEVT